MVGLFLVAAAPESSPETFAQEPGHSACPSVAIDAFADGHDVFGQVTLTYATSVNQSYTEVTDVDYTFYTVTGQEVASSSTTLYITIHGDEGESWFDQIWNGNSYSGYPVADGVYEVQAEVSIPGSGCSTTVTDVFITLN